MLRTLTLAAVAAFGLGLGTSGAMAAGKAGEVTDFAFSFEGPFGRYDPAQLQRGLQVYTQACAACHGLQYVAFRNLADPGGLNLTEQQMRAFAAEWEIFDPEIDDWRAATPPDHFPANDAAGAPDLSLMAKARAGFEGPFGTGINQFLRGIGGPEYIASLLLGYTGVDDFQAGTVLYENTAFPGGWISMGPVLFEDLVFYEDGTAATEEQMALDVAAFLMWSAEPKMMERKRAGFIGVGMLTLLAVLLYLSNKQLWAPVKRKDLA
ncbi:MAG: cytochrome c1 [Rhodobacteraceae bacterium]|nr:cytochrome c1 [Paracoccaceae bacterium]